MKKDSLIIEFVKSGPFLLLLILAVLILLGIVLSNKKKNVVRMKEEVIYVSPSNKK
jgi:hypothetical protein